MKAIVTVIGEDKVGIIAAVSAILAEAQVNIMDISQTIMQDIFTMMMVVDLSGMNTTFEQLNQRLGQQGEKMGLSIRVQREDIFTGMNRI